MRQEFITKADAEAFQAKIHAALIVASSEYAKSAAAGQTTAWAIPYQDVDDGGKVIGTAWYVNVKERCMDTLNQSEKMALKPIKKG